MNFKSFFRSLQQFFLTVGQNNFGNKIPLVTFSPNFFHVFKEEESSLEDEETCGCCKWPSLIDYDQELIPPEPNFFTAGFFWEKQDRSVIFFYFHSVPWGQNLMKLHLSS